MEDTSGFYKQKEVAEWMFAPNFVYSTDYELTRENKDSYIYPVDEWYWFDESPEVEDYHLTQDLDDVELKKEEALSKLSPEEKTLLGL